MKGILFGPPVAIPFTVVTLGKQWPQPHFVFRVTLKENPLTQRTRTLFSLTDRQQKLSEHLCREVMLLPIHLSPPHRPISTVEELVSSSTHPDGKVIFSSNGLSLQLSFFAVKMVKVRHSYKATT